MALSTLGPGATNLTTAAAYAFLGAFPMLMLTGQKPVLKSKQARSTCAGLLSCSEPWTRTSWSHGESAALGRTGVMKGA